MNSLNPFAYLRDVLERLPTARARDLDALLPWNWKPTANATISPQSDEHLPLLSAQ